MTAYIGDDVELGEHFSTAIEGKNLYSHLESHCGSFGKFGIKPPEDQSMPILDIYPKESQS